VNTPQMVGRQGRDGEQRRAGGTDLAIHSVGS